ncbi:MULTISPECIES: RimK family alpha-L-glutamate ligase [unclassified Nocardia]|uniref:ATP-grasp domain-containing protein n=1 Tax=unclassified Nocardia TaxID=2637762 RepID=UPI001CE3BCF8|nr:MULTISPECIES: hypothetical protein [unclassified Nocardia]
MLAASGASPESPHGPGAMRRRCFVAQIECAARQLDVDLTWYSDHWVAHLRYAGRQQHLVGYAFPLNDLSAAHLADDKVATSVVLARDGVPHIHHELLWLAAEAEFEVGALAVLDRVSVPLVVKPCTGRGGLDVFRATSVSGYLTVVRSLARSHRTLAVCPLIAIEREFRVIYLRGSAELTFEKVRPDGHCDWRHNLEHGAVPVVVDDSATCAALAALAKQAATALGISFASIDIVQSDRGLEVLELNSGVSLEYFSRSNSEHFQLAAGVYRRALQACLDC